MKAELVSKKCRHLQNDGSTTYYAIKLHGVDGVEHIKEGAVLRLTETAYAAMNNGVNNAKTILQSVVDYINAQQKAKKGEQNETRL